MDDCELVIGDLKDETDLAFLFFDGKKNHWLPKSLCEWDKDENEMKIPLWLIDRQDIWV